MAKLEAIRAFIVVARHGNLRDAGAELGRTQSALSMALGQLEDMLGGPLFESDRKRELTDLGRYVHDLGEELVREHDRVQALIYAYAKGETGRLRIASVPSVAALILPDLLRSFMAAHPGVQIDLMDSDSTQVRSMVADGRADLGIAGPAPTGKTLAAQSLFTDRLHVVCHRESPFAQWQGALHWRDLAGASFIANETLLALASAEARAIVSRSKLSVRNLLSLFAMVDSGLGLTVLPGLATRSLIPSLVAKPLSDDNSTRPISLLSRAGRTESPLTASFRAFLSGRLPALSSQYDLVIDQPQS